MTIRTRRSRALLAVVLCVVIVGTAVSLAAALAARGVAQPEYTVASSMEAESVAGGLVLAPGAPARGVFENLKLLAVGALLLGLAAAVRRTA